jgi:hypothetical protein
MPPQTLVPVPVIEIAGRQYDATNVHRLIKPSDGEVGDFWHLSQLIHAHDLYLRGDTRRCYDPVEPGMLLFASPTRVHLLHRERVESPLVDIIFETPQLAVAFGQEAKPCVPRLGFYSLDGKLQAVDSMPSVHHLDGNNTSLASPDGRFTVYGETIGVDSLNNDNGAIYQICDVHYNNQTNRARLKFEGCIVFGANTAPKNNENLIRPSGFEDCKLSPPNSSPEAFSELGKQVAQKSDLTINITAADFNQVYYLRNLRQVAGELKDADAHYVFLCLTCIGDA